MMNANAKELSTTESESYDKAHSIVLKRSEYEHYDTVTDRGDGATF
jgi:hypothetical protein